MADTLCNGAVASPCGRDVAGRARGAARAALAESLQVAGHASKTSFSAGRMSVKDSKPRPLSRSLEAAAPGQVGFGSPLQLFVCLSCCSWESFLCLLMRFLCSCFTCKIPPFFVLDLVPTVRIWRS